MSIQNSPRSTTFNDENSPMTDDEAVHKVLKFAKLDVKNLLTNVQSISFSSSLKSDSLKLLELDPAVAKVVEDGGKLVFKGNPSDNCVLCTDDRTFDIKDASITNSLLLVPDLRVAHGSVASSSKMTLEKKTVEAVSHNYLEMKLIRPKLRVIQDTLLQSAYEGEDKENEKTNKVTMNDLICNVLASRVEIIAELGKLGAFSLRGFQRLLDHDFKDRVLSSITSLIDEESWTVDRVDMQHTCDTLKTLYLPEITAHVLKQYGSPLEDDSNIYSLKEDQICRSFAEMLLRPTQKFNLEEFTSAWQQIIPEGMMTSQEQLNGMAFVDSSSSPAVIRYFPESRLSEDIKERLNELFTAKDSWTLQEITPYLQNLCIGKMTVSVMLTKYARAFSKSGVKYYTSKYVR